MTAPHPWFYDEMKHVGVDYDSVKEVENYDRRMSEIRNVQSEITEIIAALDLAKEHSLLEFGSGTGELTIAAAERCGRVYAVDISNIMLEYAAKKARSKNISNITFIQSGFLNYRHVWEPVDAVVTQLALHHLPDFWKQIALMKMNDVMKPGGRLYLRDIVFSIKLEKYTESINHVMKNFHAAAGDEMVEKFSSHIKNEYSTFDWVMEEMLYRAGFHIEDADYRDNFLTVYVCRKVKRD